MQGIQRQRNSAHGNEIQCRAEHNGSSITTGAFSDVFSHQVQSKSA